MEVKKDNTRKTQKLSESNWIVKSNTLNEIRNNKMTPSQLRFFSIYLSKINPQNEETRLVTFPLSEYTRIMGFKQVNITRLHYTAEQLLGLTATFTEYDKSGRFAGMTICQLFKCFKLFKDSNNEEWFVSIDCHDEVLPYMFDFKKYYFKYQLWNALRLGTVNHLRMYEILKQYETAGAREIKLTDLRAFLGIGDDEYPRWDNFKRRVIDSCQQALLESTDIKFTYEPIKKGRGGKITAIKFNIEKNEKYIDNLTLDEYIEQQPLPELECELKAFCFENETLEFLAESCNNEFNEPQMQVIYDLVKIIIPFSNQDVKIERYNYLLKKYNELNYRDSRENLSPIQNRYGYFKKIIEADIIKDKK